jgi:hypothetical protein
MTGHLLGAAGGIEAVAAIQVGLHLVFSAYLSYTIVYKLSFGPDLYIVLWFLEFTLVCFLQNVDPV